MLAGLFLATSLLLASALTGTCLYIYRTRELIGPAR
jgi:hypothetical protein